MAPFKIEKHHAEPLYVGCPHCEGPVYVGIQIHGALSWLAMLLAERETDKDLKRKLEVLAADCGERAWDETLATWPFRQIRQEPKP